MVVGGTAEAVGISWVAAGVAESLTRLVVDACQFVVACGIETSKVGVLGRLCQFVAVGNFWGCSEYHGYLSCHGEVG